MRGRKPVPPRLRALDGGAGKRGALEATAQPDGSYGVGAVATTGPAAELPAPPEDLSDGAKKVWLETGTVLAEAGLMSKVFGDPFRLYCDAAARYYELCEAIDEAGGETRLFKTPNGYPMPNPLVHRRDKAWEQMLKIAVEFGMTPTALARVETLDQLSLFPADGQNGETADPFEAYRRKRRQQAS